MSNVMIVDDSGTMRKIIMRGLRQADLGFENFVEASDGVEGLEAFDKQPLDLVLSDINMPNMSGLDFVKEVRAKFGADTPIVMITTEGRDEVVEQATALGANGFLKKPFTPDQLSETLKPLLG